MDNYYKILGVKNFATLDEIKIAYKKLAKKFHPDVNDGDRFFTEKFQELQKVYEVFSNISRRKMYDEKLIAFFNILDYMQRWSTSASVAVAPTHRTQRASSYMYQKGRFVRRRRL